MRKRNERIIIAVGTAIILSLGAWIVRGQLLSNVDSFAKCAEEGYPITESNPPTCSDGRQTFVGPRLTPAPDPAPSESLSFELLVQGDSAGDYPQRQEVITNQADWQKYWRAVHASADELPPILPVDFSSENVVALSEGQKATGGYSLKITSIMKSSSGTTVNVTETVPAATCVVTQAASNRYLIVKTPTLTEPVSFRISTDHREC